MARQGGFAVTIKGFLPVEKGNLDSSINAATTLKEAITKGDITGLAGMLKNVSVDHKQGSYVPGEGDQSDIEDQNEGETDGKTADDNPAPARSRRRR